MYSRLRLSRFGDRHFTYQCGNLCCDLKGFGSKNDRDGFCAVTQPSSSRNRLPVRQPTLQMPVWELVQ